MSRETAAELPPDYSLPAVDGQQFWYPCQEEDLPPDPSTVMLQSRIVEAAAAGDLDGVRQALAAGADVNGPNPVNQKSGCGMDTPLISAARCAKGGWRL